MIAATESAKQRWAIAAVIGVATIAVAVAVFRAPPVALPVPPPALIGVELQKVTAEEATLGEETMMRDLTPLFLPTVHNATLRRLPSREPGKTFLEIEAPKLVVTDIGWRFDRGLPAAVTLNAQPLAASTPIDYLEEANADAAFVGFGRDEQPVPTLLPRGGVLDVVRTRDGDKVLSDVLRADARPPTEKVWQPLEFLASVGPAGLVAPLAFSVRSGVEEVDVYFRNYLSLTYQIGARLPPGIYRITVAP